MVFFYYRGIECVFNRFKPALQDGVVENILSLIACSLRGFKHIKECCECGYSVFLSEDGRTDRTHTHNRPLRVCAMEREGNIGRVLSARRHFFCFSSKIYVSPLRGLSSDRVTYTNNIMNNNNWLLIIISENFNRKSKKRSFQHFYDLFITLKWKIIIWMLSNTNDLYRYIYYIYMHLK